MIRKMYVIRDVKAAFYHPPMCYLTHGDAERNFSLILNDERAKFFKEFPEDYSLWYIGDYDDASASISPQKIPLHIVDAVALVQKNPQ